MATESEVWIIYIVKIEDIKMILTDLERKLNGQYSIVRISDMIIDDVFEIMKLNKYFYSRTQLHEISREECQEDMYALPPNTDMSQKFYVALYKRNECVALLDYVEGYPASNVIYLGFFMLNPKFQRAGIGGHIVGNFIECVQNNGFTEIKLACYEANKIGLAFWNRMGFIKEKVSARETDGKIYNLIEMHKVL